MNPSAGASSLRPVLHAAAAQALRISPERPESEGAGGIRIARVDSASVMGSLSGAEPSAKKQRVEERADSKGSLVIFGGTGSQGAALAYAASQSHLTHGREILIPARDSKKASELEVMVDGKAFKLGNMPGVRIVEADSIKAMDASRMIAIATVPSGALASVLRQIPKNPQGLVATYNGVPRSLPEGLHEPEHVVSMIPSFAVPQKPSAFAFKPGALIHDKLSPVAQDLARIFGSTFAVQSVDNGRHAQWTKIATNTAANSLATLFGIKVMDLRAKIDGDSSFQKLLKGVAAETCMVARREGVELNVDSLYDQVLAKIPPNMDHFTSTGMMFRAGAPLEEDIASLSGGLAKAAPLSTPVCSALASSLMKLQEERGQSAMPADFYSRDAVKAIQAHLLSPQMMAQAEASAIRAGGSAAAGVGPAAQAAPAAVVLPGGGASGGPAVLRSRL